MRFARCRRPPAGGEDAPQAAAEVADAAVVEVIDGASQMGSGSLPTHDIPTRLLAVAPAPSAGPQQGASWGAAAVSGSASGAQHGSSEAAARAGSVPPQQGSGAGSPQHGSPAAAPGSVRPAAATSAAASLSGAVGTSFSEAIGVCLTGRGSEPAGAGIRRRPAVRTATRPVPGPRTRPMTAAAEPTRTRGSWTSGRPRRIRLSGAWSILEAQPAFSTRRVRRTGPGGLERPAQRHTFFSRRRSQGQAFLGSQMQWPRRMDRCMTRRRGEGFAKNRLTPRHGRSWGRCALTSAAWAGKGMG